MVNKYTNNSSVTLLLLNRNFVFIGHSSKRKNYWIRKAPIGGISGLIPTIILGIAVYFLNNMTFWIIGPWFSYKGPSITG